MSTENPIGKTGNYQKLLDFSLGRIPYRTLMHDFHIDSDEQLFLLMCGAGLRIPALPEEDLEKMENIFRGIQNY